MVRRGLVAGFVVAACATAAPSAGAAVTIGQLGVPFPTSCGPGVSWAQPSVTSGPSYVSPVNGTVTNWTTNAGLSDDIKLKIWHVVGGTLLKPTGGSALVTTSSSPQTFPASIPIAAGDSIGLFTAETANCLFEVPGQGFLSKNGAMGNASDDIPDGLATNFSQNNNFRVSILASVEPTSNLQLGGASRNKKKGNATLTVTVPNPGQLTATGNGVGGSATAAAAGKVQLKIKAQGKKKGKLNSTGKVTVKPKITFTPTGGKPSSASAKVTLKKG